jgi:hypothetical protein
MFKRVSCRSTINRVAGHGSELPEKLPNYRDTVFMTDGGVRDNLGLAPILEINRLRTSRKSPALPLYTFVSDGGRTYDLDPAPSGNWLFQLMRIMAIAISEPDQIRVEDLVRGGRQAMAAVPFRSFPPPSGDTEKEDLKCRETSVSEQVAREGLQHSSSSEQTGRTEARYAYGSIRRMPKHHSGFACPPKGRKWVDEDDIIKLSRLGTRFAALSDSLQERLINWGYLATHHGIPYIPLFWTDAERSKRLNVCALPYKSTGLAKQPADMASYGELCLLLNKE